MQTETPFLKFWRDTMPNATIHEANVAYSQQKFVIASLRSEEDSVVMTEYDDEREARLAYNVMKSGEYIMLDFYPVTVH